MILYIQEILQTTRGPQQLGRSGSWKGKGKVIQMKEGFGCVVYMVLIRVVIIKNGCLAYESSVELSVVREKFCVASGRV